MRVLGLIPARGGSKGIPRKNIKLLNGRPLIGYTIAAARASKGLSKVVVSTEDPEIAEISKALGAAVPFLRPPDLAEDTAPTIDAVIHALKFFNELNEVFDAVCLLQPTVPFRGAPAIDRALEKFESTNADSLISVAEIPHRYHPKWSFLESPDTDFLSTGWDEIIPRRQDLPKAYYRDGSIYITKTRIILEHGSLYGEKITYVESGPVINIDTPEDWEQAEAYISRHEG